MFRRGCVPPLGNNEISLVNNLSILLTLHQGSRVCIFSDFIFSVENRKKYFFSAEKTEKPKKSQKPKKPKKMAQKTEKNEKRRRNPKKNLVLIPFIERT